MWSNLFEISTSDDSFYFIPKKHLKLSQKANFLAHFERFLVYTFLRPMSYTPIFCQILWSYIIVLSFISVAFLVAKLQIFKCFRGDEASMKWPLLGGFWALSSPNMAHVCLNFDQRYSLIIQRQSLNNLSKLSV